jgi:hypothetical protein
MSRKSIFALMNVAVLGLATIVPTAASARGVRSSGGRLSFGFGALTPAHAQGNNGFSVSDGRRRAGPSVVMSNLVSNLAMPKLDASSKNAAAMSIKILGTLSPCRNCR